MQKRGTTGRAAKAAAPTRKRKQEDEDLDDAIDSDDDNVVYEEEAEEDEFADETADEKRVRLAKKYLADLGHGVDAGDEDDDEDDAAVRRKQALDHSAIAHRFEAELAGLAPFRMVLCGAIPPPRPPARLLATPRLSRLKKDALAATGKWKLHAADQISQRCMTKLR